jgi:hypothetical protein
MNQIWIRRTLRGAIEPLAEFETFDAAFQESRRLRQQHKNARVWIMPNGEHPLPACRRDAKHQSLVTNFYKETCE